MQARSNRFPSRRSPVLGTHGMVATSQPLAALAGLRALQAGGNAADAAITMAVTLNVVEPHATGAGGDAFALVRWANDGKVRAMNGSGRAPAARRASTSAPQTAQGRRPRLGRRGCTRAAYVGGGRASTLASMRAALAPRSEVRSPG